MLIHAGMSLDLLGQESNLNGNEPCVRIMRDLLVRNYAGQDTLDLWRAHQKQWLALWDEAIGSAEPDAPTPAKSPAKPKRPPASVLVEGQMTLWDESTTRGTENRKN